jgi:hypothetical protein
MPGDTFVIGVQGTGLTTWIGASLDSSNNHGQYASGRLHRNANPYANLDEWDMTFRTYVNLAPEPASLILFITGVASLGVRRFFKRN